MKDLANLQNRFLLRRVIEASQGLLKRVEHVPVLLRNRHLREEYPLAVWSLKSHQFALLGLPCTTKCSPELLVFDCLCCSLGGCRPDQLLTNSPRLDQPSTKGVLLASWQLQVLCFSWLLLTKQLIKIYSKLKKQSHITFGCCCFTSGPPWPPFALQSSPSDSSDSEIKLLRRISRSFNLSSRRPATQCYIRYG